MNTILTRAFGAAFFTVAVTEFTQIGALLIDGIITSRYLGASEIAAVGVASPFYFLVGIIGTGVAVGLQTVCTREMGSGNTTRMNYVFNETLEAALAVSLLFTFLVLAAASPMAFCFGARGNAADLQRDTVLYLRGLSFEVVPYVLLSVLTPVVILDNDDRVVMVSSFIGGISNVVFDIMFVRLNGGIWGMGMATSLSVILSFLVLMTHFLKKNRLLHLMPTRIVWADIKEILVLSGPKAVHQAAGMLRPIILNALIIAAGGSMAMSVMSIRTSIADFVDVPAVGIAGAVGLLAGIGYGEVNGEDMEYVSIIALRSIVASSALITVLLLVFARPIAVFYLGEDSEAIPLMMYAIGTIAAGTFFSELSYTIISYLQAIENTRYAQIMEIQANLVSLIVCAFLLSIPFGIYGIFSAYPISQLIVFLTFVGRGVIRTKKLPPTRQDYLELDSLFYKGPGDEIAYPIETLDHCTLASEQVYLFCKGHGLDKRKAFHASLCIEEVTTNIIEHGFVNENRANRAEIRVTLNKGTLIIRVRDNGREFDLSKLARILMDDSAPYSNIGIKLICKSAKDIHYYRIWGMNTTILEI